MKTNSSLKIFMVDDDPFCSTIYQQYLLNLGYSDVTVFNNGMACFDTLDQKPDVVFLDGQVDEKSGSDMLKGIKLFNPNIYVVFLSGEKEFEKISAALEAGAFDYIIKDDGDLEVIKDVIQRIVKVKDQLKRLNPTFIRKLLSIL